MYRFVVLLLCAISVYVLPSELLLPGVLPAATSSTYEPVPEIDEKIIGGTPARLGQFPYQAALYMLDAKDGSVFFCGGALISPKYILTAAHCIHGRKIIRDISLGIVNLNSSSGRVWVRPNMDKIHKNYSTSTYANDIALVQLQAPVALSSTVNTISLASGTLDSGVSVTASGWGRTSDSSHGITQNLNYVSMVTITNKECASFYGRYINSGNVCARGNDIKSTCSGDSGGPVVTGSGNSAVHVGIVSFGSSQGCAKGYPVGFTRTGASRTWISSMTGI